MGLSMGFMTWWDILMGLSIFNGIINGSTGFNRIKWNLFMGLSMINGLS